MIRALRTTLLVCLSLVAACAGDSPLELEVEQEALTYFPDTAPDPLPIYADTIQPNAVYAIYPGAVACFPPLSANQSAGLAGYFAFSVTKLPKLIVWHKKSPGQPFSKIFAGPISPAPDGFFSKVFNTGPGMNAALFPGIFQFCIRNPAANASPIYSNASVTTF